MKKLVFILLLFFTSNAWSQNNLTWGKEVKATEKLTVVTTSVRGISTDSSDGSKSVDKLITERAAKIYTDIHTGIITDNVTANNLKIGQLNDSIYSHNLRIIAALLKVKSDSAFFKYLIDINTSGLSNSVLKSQLDSAILAAYIQKNTDSIYAHNIRIGKLSDTAAAHNTRIIAALLKVKSDSIVLKSFIDANTYVLLNVVTKAQSDSSILASNIQKNTDSITSHNVRIGKLSDTVAAHNTRIIAALLKVKSDSTILKSFIDANTYGLSNAITKAQLDSATSTTFIQKNTDSLIAHNTRIGKLSDTTAAHNTRIIAALLKVKNDSSILKSFIDANTNGLSNSVTKAQSDSSTLASYIQKNTDSIASHNLRIGKLSDTAAAHNTRLISTSTKARTDSTYLKGLIDGNTSAITYKADKATTITINSITQDLSASRSWTISTDSSIWQTKYRSDTSRTAIWSSLATKQSSFNGTGFIRFVGTAPSYYNTLDSFYIPMLHSEAYYNGHYLNQNTSGNAATVTTNANLTGPVTSVGNATAIAAGTITNTMLTTAYLPTATAITTYEPIITAPNIAKYHFNGFKKPVLLVSDSMVEGTTNLFFTTARAAAAAAGSLWSLTGNSGNTYASNFFGTLDTANIRFRVNNIEKMTLDPAGVLRLKSLGSIVFDNRELTMGTSSVGGYESIAIGNFITAPTAGNIILGKNINDGGFGLNFVAVNKSSALTLTSSSTVNILANNTSGIGIGPGATTSGGANNTEIAIGSSATTSGAGVEGNIAIGRSASATGAWGIALGAFSVAGVGEFVSGYSGKAVSNIYFGSGKTAATVSAYTLNGSGASGTDIAGGSITIAGGKGTGTGLGGDVILSTTAAGATGTILQTLSPRWYVKAASGQLSNNSTPNSSALTDFQSTTQGVLYPRMTSTQMNAIPTPAIGLVVFNITDSSTYEYSGTTWYPMRTSSKASSTGWSRLGNSVYNRSTFIGSTDTSQFRIRTKNVDRLTIDSAGNMGINVPTSSTMTVTGNSYFYGNSIFASQTGGPALTIANNQNIRGGGTGTGANYYIDGSTDGSGTISVRANILSVAAQLNAANSIAAGFDVNAGSTNMTGGYGLKLGGNYLLQSDIGGTILRVNDNTNFKTVFTKSLNSVLTDQGTTVNGFVPKASTLLDMESTTKGFLPPQLTTTQKNAIAYPATGLIVYDSTYRAISTYNGTAWVSASPTTVGTATLAAGTVTVSAVGILTTSKIFVSVATAGGTQGFLSTPTASIVSATSFVIKSSSTNESSTVNYSIVN